MKKPEEKILKQLVFIFLFLLNNQSLSDFSYSQEADTNDNSINETQNKEISQCTVDIDLDEIDGSHCSNAIKS